MISLLDLLSRLPVGSSARIIGGFLARARATATLCCSPPDISLGRCLIRSDQSYFIQGFFGRLEDLLYRHTSVPVRHYPERRDRAAG